MKSSVKNDAFYSRANSNSAKFCFDNVPVGMNSLNKILPDKLRGGGAGLTCTTMFQISGEEKINNRAKLTNQLPTKLSGNCAKKK